MRDDEVLRFFLSRRAGEVRLRTSPRSVKSIQGVNISELVGLIVLPDLGPSLWFIPGRNTANSLILPGLFLCAWQSL